MDDQALSQLLGSSQNGTNQALSGVQSQLGILIWVGTAASIVVTIVFIIYLVYKMRTQSAILRIDKNLQRLVDAQIPKTEKVVDSQDMAQDSDIEHIEQK